MAGMEARSLFDEMKRIFAELSTDDDPLPFFAVLANVMAMNNAAIENELAAIRARLEALEG